MDKKFFLVKNLLKKEEIIIEKNLLFPVVTENDIDEWVYKIKYFIILPYEIDKNESLSLNEIKERFPYTYKYLSDRKDNLLSPKLAQTLFNVPKVIIKRGRNTFVATVVERFRKKPIIPLADLSYINVHSEQWAHYICSLINAGICKEKLKDIGSTCKVSDKLFNEISSLSNYAHRMKELGMSTQRITSKLKELVKYI